MQIVFSLRRNVLSLIFASVNHKTLNTMAPTPRMKASRKTETASSSTADHDQKFNASTANGLKGYDDERNRYSHELAWGSQPTRGIDPRKPTNSPARGFIILPMSKEIHFSTCQQAIEYVEQHGLDATIEGLDYTFGIGSITHLAKRTKTILCVRVGS